MGNRITKKDDRFYNGNTCGGWKKLQKLENIEERIGIDLEVLELIHNHPIQFSWVAQSKNYAEYSFMGGTTTFKFDVDEYNKLKEWLEQ